MRDNGALMRTRVKICGITSEADAAVAAEAGADAIGLVFYPPSPRAVSIPQAAAIVRSLPPFVTSVALFVDAGSEAIAEVVDNVRVDLLQFHGQESADFCGRHRRPWIRAIRMRTDMDPREAVTEFAAAQGVLLDAYRPGVPGGTGEVFDWGRVPGELASRLVLAGGLTPDNVAEAVATVGPYAVDVSGGVEQSPGVKDANKIKAFIEEVRCARHQ